MRIPEKFKERMKSYPGVDTEKLFSALESDEAVKSFRVNNIKISTPDFMAINPFDAKEIPFAKDGFYTTLEKPGSHPYHHAGLIYMQDPSAMITVKAIDVKEGWRVFDACACPGGKTTQLSAAIGDSGILVSNEYVTKRCRILEENTVRLGCRNTVILNLDTKYIAEAYPEKFNLVLCDAPCSGEGMFRKNIAAIEEWSLQNVEMCAERQREILDNCAICVAEGGYLLYSTCTFSLEENEKNIKWFLDKYPEFELCPVSDAVRLHTADGINLEGCDYDMTLTRRFYPYVSDGEGQFIALMRKNYSTQSKSSKRPKKNAAKDLKKFTQEQKEAVAVAEKFIAENMEGIEYLKPLYYNGKVYLSPDIELTEFGVFSVGVLMGEVRKGRLIPAHHLFSALGNNFKNKIYMSLDDERLADYIGGFEIKDENAKNGWNVIILDGAPLGGVKVSGGSCKNHYL